MDPVSPPNIPDDPEMHPAGVQEPHQPPRPRTSPAHSGPPAYDSVSILTVGPVNDTDSVHAGHPATDGDSIQTAPPTYDTDSTQTAHFNYDTDSNRTLNPAYDTDSTRALHPAYVLEQMAADGAAGPEASGSITAVNPSEEPPPYSPPDPKMTYLIYPPPLPHYSNQPVIACQPGANPPAFYQPSFLPPSTYPSYAIFLATGPLLTRYYLSGGPFLSGITVCGVLVQVYQYMNGPPLGEEQPPLPKDYLVESLLVTIFCCLMSGLVAVMYSYETRAALARGDIREAERASQKARLLVMFSLMFGVFVFVGWIVYVVIAVCA